jgi:CheY-like chemotaxis protein
MDALAAGGASGDPLLISTSMHPFVLVVEGEEGMRRALCEVLMGRGYHVADAADGEEARAWLSRHPSLGAIVLDVMLPGPTGMVAGRELLRWIRSQPEPLKSVPVVLLSAASPTALREVARRHGANAFLEKPAGVVRLIPELQRLVPVSA